MHKLLLLGFAASGTLAIDPLDIDPLLDPRPVNFADVFGNALAKYSPGDFAATYSKYTKYTKRVDEVVGEDDIVVPPTPESGGRGWRCGNPKVLGGDHGDVNGSEWQNKQAGIVFLKEGSIDHVRTKDAPAHRTTFDDLFCASYLRGYKNPTDAKNPGVCIRNNLDVGKKWDSIVAADADAKAHHEMYGTANDYQRTAAKHKSSPNSFQTMWGSGAEGSNPNNWCSAYMKEMMCHVAFPQFSGNAEQVTGTATAESAEGFEAFVRPVGVEACESMMDNCNRRWPRPYKATIDELTDEAGRPALTFTQMILDQDNTMWCSIWNRGFGLAQAGTGVAGGDFASDPRETAEWDSASALTPIGFLALAATVLAALQ